MLSASTVYFSGGLAGGEGAPWVDNVSTADGPSWSGLDGESSSSSSTCSGWQDWRSPWSPGIRQGGRWVDKQKIDAFAAFKAARLLIAEEPEPVQGTLLSWGAQLFIKTHLNQLYLGRERVRNGRVQNW